uniref:4-coumarate--CoA ligase n=1 Tax=Oryza brachyantha TaxID=4533 RepID=J3LJL0_ORYBR
MDQLTKRPANYVPLSPVGFLPRANAVYGDRTSVVYGRVRFTWSQTYARCRRFASSLLALGVHKNDVVSVLAPNVPAMYEMHFAVPMAGAVLNTINTRLDAKAVAAILRHSEAKLFFVDYQYVRLASDALQLVAGEGRPVPLVAVIDDIDMPTGVRLGELEYEGLVARGDPTVELPQLADEWDAVTLNYTSGTTSEPKGVVYSRRGAYLSTMSLLMSWVVGDEPVYLWTLPMFHCNGWTFTWGMAARGGVNVCIRDARAADIYRAIARHGVTHLCCAPVVFNILLEGGDAATQLAAPDKAAGVCEDDVLAFCRKHMPRFMVPKKVVVYDVIPRNGNGKVEKNLLREAARKLAPAVPAQKTKVNKTTSTTTVGGGSRGEHPVAHVMAVSRL